MKADSITVFKAFQNGGDIHYVLPHFQREYAWERDEWNTLLEDTFAIYEEMPEEQEAADNKSSIEHFLGSLVVIESGTISGTIPVFTLVDGQQRLTTLSLLLCALRRLVTGSHPPLAKKIANLLVNQDEQGDAYFKLLPTTKYGDREAYQAIILDKPVALSESRILGGFDHLYQRLRAKLDSGIQPDRLFRVIANAFQVVLINLNRDESPYKIFESLNAKGRPLTQADLVRNFIAMTLPPSGQETIFCDYWAPIEAVLQEKRSVGRSGIGELTAFLRHYLAMDSRILYSEKHVYARFRDRIRDGFANVKDFTAEIKALHDYAQLYDRILRPERQTSAAIRKALHRLEILDLSTAYPFLLAVFYHLHVGILTESEVVNGLQLIENYLMRRFLAEEPTNYLNKMFPQLWHQVDLSDFARSLEAALLTRTRKYPSDTRIRQQMMTRSLYGRRRETSDQLRFLLEEVNRSLSAGTGATTELAGKPTIEHVLPQTLTPEWETVLGPDAARVDEFRHTIGNLTLVTPDWNSSLSNAPFATKKAKLATHGLRLNSDYFVKEIPEWNETAINARSAFLIDRILMIWPSLITEGNSGDLSQANLFFTQVSGTFAGKSVSSWKELLHEAIRATTVAGLTIDTLRDLTEAHIVEGVFDERGYSPVNATPYSAQSMDAERSKRAAFAVAERLGYSVELGVTWGEHSRIPQELRGRTIEIRHSPQNE